MKNKELNIFIQYAKIKVKLKTLRINYTDYSILQLLSLKRLKFSQIQHTFNWSEQTTSIHLKGFIKLSYIVKDNEYYSLTVPGRQYLNDINVRLKRIK